MIIKLELLVEVDDEHMKFIYRSDSRNWPRIILGQITNIEDADYKVIVGEAKKVK